MFEGVRKDPRVLAALRKAMKAGRTNEVVLIANIEDFAPAEVRRAFDDLIETVVAVAREASEPPVATGGVGRIAAERERQQTEKGWTLEHDRTEHADGSLTDAAAALILEYDGAPEVEKKDAELSSAQEAYLRACGWAHTCDAPGSVWLWARPYQGRVLLVPREFAVHMQDHIDSGVYSAEGEPRDALERMGEDMHPAFTAPDTRDPLAHGATANDARADAEIAAMDQDDRLRRIANIIDGVDNRCAAAGDPVTLAVQWMTQRELSTIYALAIGRNT
jgi:hypothetical protein